MHGTIQGKYGWPLSRGVMVFSLLLLLAFLVPPAAAVVNVGSAGIVYEPPIPLIQSVGTGIALAASPPVVITILPTPVPTRQNRVSVLQTAAKNAVDRPKVTIPSSLFIIIVTIAFIGILAILYHLLRRDAGSSVVRKNLKNPIPDHATIIEEPADQGPVQEVACGYPGPAVRFPPSLEKRFLNPEFIGEGGLGRVFRVQNAKTGMTVAVKVPARFDEITGTHFTRDIVLWQGLLHPNIIRIWSSNILPVPYIEMEYAPASLASTHFPLPEESAIGMILGIARGLGYAHGSGIIHRDIKPENILLTAEGIPKITDWGLGKAIGDIHESSVIGFSPAYAAPEQIAPHRYGKPGPATDIYQLGMLLYEMLTGTPAFSGEGMHDLNVAILENTPDMPSWNGRHEKELREIILRCLSKRPQDRYSSVADLIRDLELVQARFT
jgi:hypothetical protein